MLDAVFRAAFVPIVGEHVVEGEYAAGRAARWHAVLTDERNTVLVAELAGDVVAVASFARAPDAGLDPVTTARIHSFHVHPTRWRTGIGRRLMGVVLAHLLERGFREAVLWSLGENERANAFYEALGWRRDGAEGEWEGTPTVRYRLALDARSV